MPDWNEGAVTDIAARPRFHRETTPIWLATACTLLGCRAPDPAQTFRYAELGCGAGFGACVVAATCPRADVWGFDFNPLNIEAARNFAERCGLTNVHFVEASFAELAKAEPGQFDFIVAEAVLGLISDENQHHLRTVIGRQLRPGGLVYLGYRCETGWTEFAPLQAVLRMRYEQGIEASDFAILQGFDYLDQLKTRGAMYFRRNPGIASRLEEMRRQPEADLALEFLNRDWRALMFADVVEAMAEVKCDFLGRATLHENVAAASVSPAMLPVLEEAASIRIRETMQDVAAGTAYRRDIYRRGLAYLPIADHHARLAAIAIAATRSGELTLPGQPGSGLTDPARYRALTDALGRTTLTVAEVRSLGLLGDEPIESAADAIALLISSGHAHPVMPDLVAQEAAATVARLNEAIIEAITRGQELNYLVSPRIGGAIETNAPEALTVGALLAGGNASDLDGLTAHVAAALRLGGRSVTRGGAPIETEAEARSVLRDAVTSILEHRVPLLRALGVLPG